MIMERGQLTFVYVVDSSKTARMRLIQTGKRYGERIEILSGLSQGDQVIVDLYTEETVAHLKACLKAGDWVLVKGSRRMKMDEIVRTILSAIGVAK